MKRKDTMKYLNIYNKYSYILLVVVIIISYPFFNIFSKTSQKSTAQSLMMEGAVSAKKGYFKDAIHNWEEAIIILKSLQEKQLIGECLNLIGFGYWNLRDYERSIIYYNQALPYLKETGNIRKEADCHYGIGNTYVNMDNYKGATIHLNKAISMYKKINYKEGQGTCLYALGLTAYSQEDYQNARVYFEQAINIFSDLGNARNHLENIIVTNLANVYFKLNNHVKAEELFEKSLTSSKKRGDFKTESMTYEALADMYTQLLEYNKAIFYLKKGLALSEKIGDNIAVYHRLTSLGTIYKNMEKYTDAIDYMKRALLIVKKIGFTTETRLLIDLGRCYFYTQDYQHSNDYYNKALNLKERLDKNSEGELHTFMGESYISLAKYDEAMSSFERALTIATQTNNLKLECDSLANIGSTFRHKSEFLKAIEIFKQALKISKKINDKMSESAILDRLGLTYYNIGEYSKAISNIKQSINITREQNDKRGEYFGLGNLANVFQKIGDYTKAIKTFEDALLIVKALKDKKGEAQILGNLSRIYSELGEYRFALKRLEHSQKIIKVLGDRRGESVNYSNFAYIYNAIGQYEKAQSNYEKALKIIKEIGVKSFEEKIRSNLGQVFLSTGKYEEAVDHFKKAKHISMELGDKNAIRYHNGNIGITYLLKGGTKKAQKLLENGTVYQQCVFYLEQNDFNKVIQLLDASNSVKEDLYLDNSLIIFVKNTMLALSYELKGDTSKSKKLYKELIKTIEGEREKLSEEQRVYFFGANLFYKWNRLTPYEGLIRLSNDEESFNNAEKIKARVLMEQIAGKHKNNLSNTHYRISENILKKEKSINNQLSLLYKKKEAAIKTNLIKKVQKITKKIDQKKVERANFIKELRSNYPEYASINYPLPLKFSELDLKSNEVLIEYAITDSETIAWLIRKNKIVKMKRIDIQSDALKLKVDSYLEMISNPAKVKNPEYDPKPGKELYELLVKEFVVDIQADEHIIIVPDECLALLPFESLVMSFPENAIHEKQTLEITIRNQKKKFDVYMIPGINFLGKKYKISYYQSASALTQIRKIKKNISGNTLLIIADPNKDLPLTKMMVQKLKTRFDKIIKTELMINYEANETDFKAKLFTKYKYIVIATHANDPSNDNRFMDRKIKEPYLILAQNSTNTLNDGFLTMTEIMDLKLNTEIIALFACETGRGKYLSGDGVMGLGRAFQYAGAKSVLVSLWNVAEISTVENVEKFFSYIIKEKDNQNDIVTSLQLARKDISSKPCYNNHPFFWAPFVIYGEL